MTCPSLLVDPRVLPSTSRHVSREGWAVDAQDDLGNGRLSQEKFAVARFLLVRAIEDLDVGDPTSEFLCINHATHNLFGATIMGARLLCCVGDAGHELGRLEGLLGGSIIHHGTHRL
jgi:hypothetical protein